jgi:hypothetical protein
MKKSADNKECVRTTEDVMELEGVEAGAPSPDHSPEDKT